MEHFVTLFDQAFLAVGLALHRSVQVQAGTGKFRLWIICMDEEVERSLAEIEFNDKTLTRLGSMSCSRLTAIRARFK